jgi:hypothetical protein
MARFKLSLNRQDGDFFFCCQWKVMLYTLISWRMEHFSLRQTQRLLVEVVYQDKNQAIKES